MILGVAIKHGQLMICLPKPNRHHDCIKYAVDVLGLNWPLSCAGKLQGFYTDTGKYLNRQRALGYVRKNGQLVNEDARCYLFSEDLW